MYQVAVLVAVQAIGDGMIWSRSQYQMRPERVLKVYVAQSSKQGDMRSRSESFCARESRIDQTVISNRLAMLSRAFWC